MLFRHILNGDRDEFAELLRIIEHVAWGQGVDVNFDDIFITNRDEGFTVFCQETFEILFQEGFLSINTRFS